MGFRKDTGNGCYEHLTVLAFKASAFMFYDIMLMQNKRDKLVAVDVRRVPQVGAQNVK